MLNTRHTDSTNAVSLTLECFYKPIYQLLHTSALQRTSGQTHRRSLSAGDVPVKYSCDDQRTVEVETNERSLIE